MSEEAARYKPDPRICMKAAQLWRRHMERPVFNQLGDGPERRGNAEEIEREALCQVLIDGTVKNTTPAQLDIFEPLEWEG